jgi:hypothetical protein
VADVVEHLPSKCKALSSSSSITKERKEGRQKRRKAGREGGRKEREKGVLVQVTTKLFYKEPDSKYIRLYMGHSQSL